MPDVVPARTRRVRRPTGSVLLLLCLLPLWPAALLLGGCAPATGPASPVRYEHVVQRDPNLSIHLVHVDLGDPRVALHVSRGGADPDGDGPWLTTLLPVRAVAEREGYDLAVNGDFFQAERTVDIEGRNTGCVTGKAARPTGPAASDGDLWSTGLKARLTLVVVNGRQPDLSVGMSLAELAALLIEHGCDTALNLDGGGSSTLVYRDPAAGRLRLLNSPSDTRKRAVADVLGVTVGAPLPPVDAGPIPAASGDAR